MIEHKFRRMTEDRFDADRQDAIIRTVKQLEAHDVADLVALLSG
jgi:2-methylcitrate dehydratase